MVTVTVIIIVVNIIMNLETNPQLIMVIRLSGVLFGLWSYERLENRTTTKQESDLSVTKLPCLVG